MKKIFLISGFFSSVFCFGQKKDTAKVQVIEEIVFQRDSNAQTSDVNNTRISTRDAKNIASVSGGIESLLKTLPSVNSNTELSSQYMVRGGNYDENLIYINDTEIYRPFLVRNSQQEGLSIINPDMVSIVNFSPGGFEAKYGDKMSSALNIYYREPTRFELSGQASIIGGRLSTGFASTNKKFTALISGRYRNTNLLLKTLNEDTDFNPKYWDLQSYLNYHISPKLNISFIGIYSNNDYEMLPRSKEIQFGSLQQPITLYVGYAGRENDSYRNIMGTATISYKPSEKWRFTLDAFAYQNREKEYYSIASAYQIYTDDGNGGMSQTNDIGSQIEHARNDLYAKTYGAQFRAKFSPNVNGNIEVGIKYEKENLRDLTNEWKLVDSLGYSVPREFAIPRDFDDSSLELMYHIAGNNKISPSRISAFAQYSQKFMLGSSKAQFNAGVRAAHWSFNGETIFSPRAQFSIKPDWRSDMLFRLSGGVYYQSPYYKEIKDLDGSFNPDIRSQRSFQMVAGNDFEFTMYDRPFKLTTDVYYKKMDRLIPYFMDNVRIRYTGDNNATGYSYGIDTRLFGEFVPGVDSWLSASYGRTFENVNGRGDIPRSTDQGFRFAVFYQDYMPAFPKMRINLTGVYATGLRTGAPLMVNDSGSFDVNARYNFTRKLPAYKRVDLGLSYVFIDPKEKNSAWGFWEKFTELSVGVQVFNAFNINNTIANQWITDVNTGNAYPAPVRLTGRFFNVTVDFKL